MTLSRILPLSRLVTLTLAVAIAATGAALAQADQEGHTDWKQGAWGHLAPYIGTYEYDAVLSDPAVDEKLTATLGAQKEHLIKNLSVHAPIGFEDDCLIMSGNAEKAGQSQKAYLNICLFAGKINAVIFDKGTISVYTARKHYEYLPQSLREWIYQAKNPDAFTARPDYVQMMSQPE